MLGRERPARRDAPGSIIAVSSTATPDNVKALDEKARAKGIDILDAPICRGRFAADEGTLLALVGGKPDVVERCAADLRCFCSDIAHLGDVGHGQVGKAMNNLLLWINAIGLIEAGRARRIHRHRPGEAARRPADELRRLRRAQGMGHDHASPGR